MKTAIWWIRRDLRLADNRALAAALAAAGQVLPVFVLDPALLASPYTGPRRLAFLLEGLRLLEADLRARGSYLVLRRGRPEQVLAGLAAETGAAAMRCLAQTGWLHNRARMIAASFLVKDLLIDWRWGERWFMQQLIDGDPAANNGGWQWVAGTGTAAAPYFRIFNPTRQGQKFDPAGDFVRRWLPELGRVPPEFIHTPWQMPAGVQPEAGCRVGQDYPPPVVDHAWARQRALAAYSKKPGF